MKLEIKYINACDLEIYIHEYDIKNDENKDKERRNKCYNNTKVLEEKIQA